MMMMMMMIISAPHSYDLIAIMTLHVSDCDCPVDEVKWVMDHRRRLLVMLVSLIQDGL
jgi:hypothetical protein